MERNTDSKIHASTQGNEKKADQPSLTEVMKRLPRSSLSLSKSDVAEMAKNIAGCSTAPANADKKAR